MRNIEEVFLIKMRFKLLIIFKFSILIEI